MLGNKRAAKRRFQLVLIKPSHYDNDGYVVQWMRSTMPSNSLAAVYSLALGAAERQLLGPDLPIDVTAMDETNTRVRTRAIARQIKENGGLGLVGIIGVQSNEFPRAVDIARQLREARHPGDDRRLPCLGLPVDAEGAAVRHQGGAGARHFHLRRRGRGRSRRGADRRGARRASPALRSHEAPAGYRRRRLAALPAEVDFVQTDHRQSDELRRRPRLPVPVLVLHHHQRARTQVALSHAGQRREDPAHGTTRKA